MYYVWTRSLQVWDRSIYLSIYLSIFKMSIYYHPNTYLFFFFLFFSSLSLVICAGTHGIQMGTSSPTNNSVLLGCIRDLRWIHASVWLQTPLERCTRGPLAGGAHRHSQCKFQLDVTFQKPCILFKMHFWVIRHETPRRCGTSPIFSRNVFRANRKPRCRRPTNRSANQACR